MVVLARTGAVFSGSLFAASAWLGGCQSKDVQSCRDKYLASHALVSSVDTNDLESVTTALEAVKDASLACERASLAEELGQLKSVQNKLESHHGYLEQRQAKRDLTPDELAKFAASGDPRCPRGQSYMYKKSGQKLKCTGPQIALMNVKEAKEYFGGRGFKVREEGPKFTAEYGAESYRYAYADVTQPATCLRVFSQPGIAWQETAARVTGIQARRIKAGQPITLGERQLAVTVTGDDTQAVLAFGDCPATP